MRWVLDLGSASSLLTGILRSRREGRARHRGVAMGEGRARLRGAATRQAVLEAPGARGGGKDSPWSLRREHSPADALI